MFPPQLREYEELVQREKKKTAGGANSSVGCRRTIAGEEGATKRCN